MSSKAKNDQSASGLVIQGKESDQLKEEVMDSFQKSIQEIMAKFEKSYCELDILSVINQIDNFVGKNAEVDVQIDEEKMNNHSNWERYDYQETNNDSLNTSNVLEFLDNEKGEKEWIQKRKEDNEKKQSQVNQMLDSITEVRKASVLILIEKNKLAEKRANCKSAEL